MSNNNSTTKEPVTVDSITFPALNRLIETLDLSTTDWESIGMLFLFGNNFKNNTNQRWRLHFLVNLNTNLIINVGIFRLLNKQKVIQEKLEN